MPPTNKHKGQILIFSGREVDKLKKNNEFQRRRAEFFKTKSNNEKEEAEKELKKMTKIQFPQARDEQIERLTTIALFDFKRRERRLYLDESLGDRVYFIYIPALKFLCNVLYATPEERKRMTDKIDKNGVDAKLFKEIEEKLKVFFREELGLNATADPYEAPPDNLARCIYKLLIKYGTRPEVDKQLYNYIKEENAKTKTELLKKDKTLKTIVDQIDKKITIKSILDEISAKKNALITQSRGGGGGGAAAAGGGVGGGSAIKEYEMIGGARVGVVGPRSLKMMQEISNAINPRTQLPLQAEAARMLSNMFSFETGEFDIRKMLEHIHAQEQCKQAIGVPDGHMLRGKCYICGQPYRGPQHDLTIECEHILCVLVAIEYYTLIQHTTLTDDQKEIARLIYLYSHACCNRKKSNLVYILQEGSDALGISHEAIMLTLAKILQDVRETAVDGIKCQTMWSPVYRSTLTHNPLVLTGGDRASEKEITGGASASARDRGEERYMTIDQIKAEEPPQIKANIDRWVNERTMEINRKVIPMVKFANQILHQIHGNSRQANKVWALLKVFGALSYKQQKGKEAGQGVISQQNEFLLMVLGISHRNHNIFIPQKIDKQGTGTGENKMYKISSSKSKTDSKINMSKVRQTSFYKSRPTINSKQQSVQAKSKQPDTKRYNKYKPIKGGAFSSRPSWKKIKYRMLHGTKKKQRKYTSKNSSSSRSESSSGSKWQTINSAEYDEGIKDATDTHASTASPASHNFESTETIWIIGVVIFVLINNAVPNIRNILNSDKGVQVLSKHINYFRDQIMAKNPNTTQTSLEAITEIAKEYGFGSIEADIQEAAGIFAISARQFIIDNADNEEHVDKSTIDNVKNIEDFFAEMSGMQEQQEEVQEEQQEQQQVSVPPQKASSPQKVSPVIAEQPHQQSQQHQQHQQVEQKEYISPKEKSNDSALSSADSRELPHEITAEYLNRKPSSPSRNQSRRRDSAYVSRSSHSNN